MNDSLFRREAIDNKSSGFTTNATMVTPLSFAVLALFMSIVAVAVIAFVVLGKYSPKDTLRGYVTTATGGVEVYAQSDGTILKMSVGEGDPVVMHEELLTMSASRATGHSAETRRELDKSLHAEQQDLLQQARLTDDAFAAQEQGLRDEIASLQARTSLLANQREALASGLELSERALQRLTTLEASAFVSSRDRDEARAAIVEYQLRLKDLELTADLLRSEIRRNQQRLSEIPVLRAARATELQVEQHRISRDIAESTGRATQRVLAPSKGIVSGLLVRAGQTITSRSPLLTIVPESSNFLAEVLVPTQTIAFVRPGATVRIRYDAYPHQKFGTFDGTIESVSQTTVLPSDKRFRINIAEPVYIARVRLSRQGVSAYGQERPLQSGMTLTADVLRDQRRLLEWVFDPLISATRKL